MNLTYFVIYIKILISTKEKVFLETLAINFNKKDNTRKTEDLISVIIPLYNSEKFIGKCINSLLGQTYDNCEIIVVDDGSTDNSLEVAQSYAQKDARVRVFSGKKYSGVSAVRNVGLKNAKGEYVCFVDSDDYVSKYFLESLITSVKDTGADISCVGVARVGESQKKKLDKPFNANAYECITYNKVEAMELLFTGRKIRMNIWNKIFHKKFFTGENNIVYNENVYHGEDVEFLYDVFSKAQKVAFVPNKYYAYTRRKGSLVHSKMNVKKLTYLSAVKYASEKCKEELPEAYTHVAGWRVGVNVETLYYMLRDGFFDYVAYDSILKTFKTQMIYLKKAKKQHLSIRLFAPLGAKLLKYLYKIRFAKKLKQAKAQDK